MAYDLQQQLGSEADIQGDVCFFRLFLQRLSKRLGFYDFTQHFLERPVIRRLENFPFASRALRRKCVLGIRPIDFGNASGQDYLSVYVIFRGEGMMAEDGLSAGQGSKNGDQDRRSRSSDPGSHRLRPTCDLGGHDEFQPALRT